MAEPIFQGSPVESRRILYTPSVFAKSSLLHLQEVGELQALQPHTSKREGLASYLFFVVTGGSGRLIYDGQAYDLAAGSCVFIDCSRPYSHMSDREDLWTLKWVHFYGPGLQAIYEKYAERGGEAAFPADDVDSFLSVLDDLYDLAESEDYIRDMRINERLSGLLTLLMAVSWHPEHSGRNGLKKQSLLQVRQYLDEHFRERITLDRLADVFYINKYYLTRVFKDQFGMTVLSYLDHIRITRAKQLLRFSELTVEQIGREVGVEEPGYFNRVFKKIEGVTPGEYRKLW